MKIELCDGGIAPVFGILDDGMLVLDRQNVRFRLIPLDEPRTIDVRSSALWIEHGGQRAFPEFFETYFSQNLIQGAPRETFVAKSYFELFDREFPRDDLAFPKYYGDGLVRCACCGRIFRPLSFLGTIRCNAPDCRSEMNNPFYDSAMIRESVEWKRLSCLSDHAGQCYCTKTMRYYSSPPGRVALIKEYLMEWVDKWLDRRQRHGGQVK